MAKTLCLLCNMPVGMFDTRYITLLGSSQPVCPTCRLKYENADLEGKFQLEDQLLKSPRLVERAVIEPRLHILMAERAKLRAKEKAQNKTKLCPCCSVPLELKLKNFSIGADGGGGLVTLLADKYVVDLYACPECGKVELYTADFCPEKGPAEESEPDVICSVCGTAHSPLINCPNCALRLYGTGRTIPKKKDTRPPWEK